MDESQEQHPPAHEPEEQPTVAPEPPVEDHQRDEGVPPQPESAEADEPQELDDDDVMIAEAITDPVPTEDAAAGLKAVIEAAIYITDEPLTAQQMAAALDQPLGSHQRNPGAVGERVCGAPDRGLSIRELAGGYKMATKPEHHESIRKFVKKLQAPLKLSLAALETLAVVAYKQPITAPEIMDIRGVQGAGVLKTLLDRKLVAAAGARK